jgi:hypothetical protein
MPRRRDSSSAAREPRARRAAGPTCGRPACFRRRRYGASNRTAACGAIPGARNGVRAALLQENTRAARVRSTPCRRAGRRRPHGHPRSVWHRSLTCAANWCAFGKAGAPLGRMNTRLRHARRGGAFRYRATSRNGVYQERSGSWTKGCYQQPSRYPVIRNS